ncbi:MAG: transglycosylase domain-containing protein, partial [Chromatiaceae bacterium]
MANKQRRSRKGGKGARRRATRSRSRSGWRIALATVLLLGLLVGGYSLYLSKTVRVKFDGKRWAVPAKVYARPLDLYAGAAISPAQLKAELRFIGYREVADVSGPAQWSARGGRFTIHTRDAFFWDGEEPAQRIRLDTAEGVIDRIRTADGREIDLFRLEPALIGSIYPAHNEDRVLVQRGDLPDHLVEALLAVEDRRFFEHRGVDLRGIARALWTNVRAGRVVQGGSTLTQQLVKNFVLTADRSLWRKFNEAFMALLVDARYGKDEILEAYANEVFLGQDGARAIHGFGLG